MGAWPGMQSVCSADGCTMFLSAKRDELLPRHFKTLHQIGGISCYYLEVAVVVVAYDGKQVVPCVLFQSESHSRNCQLCWAKRPDARSTFWRQTQSLPRSNADPMIRKFGDQGKYQTVFLAFPADHSTLVLRQSWGPMVKCSESILGIDWR